MKKKRRRRRRRGQEPARQWQASKLEGEIIEAYFKCAHKYVDLIGLLVEMWLWALLSPSWKVHNQGLLIGPHSWWPWLPLLPCAAGSPGEQTLVTQVTGGVLIGYVPWNVDLKWKGDFIALKLQKTRRACQKVHVNSKEEDFHTYQVMFVV
jgi:hypothetical protein